MLPPDLKRFSDSNIRASKLSTYVNFPLKELDLREFASESSGEYRVPCGRDGGEFVYVFRGQASDWPSAAELT